MSNPAAEKNSFHNVEQAQIPVDSGGDQLGFALFLAIAVHALIIFGIGFTIALSSPPAPTLEVTLAQHNTEQQPEEADYLAQHNQQGSGDQSDKAQITTDRQSPLPAPAVQETEPVAATPQQRRHAEATALLTTTAASDRSTPSAERAEQDTGEQAENFDQATRQELASLQARLDQQRQEYSRMPRINRLTAASTRSANEAAYMHYWVQRIEQTGNRFYPEEARRRGIFGNLRLAVTLLPDGDVESIEILQSSGQAILDQAAIRIVRQAGPFDPFPSELKEWDKFEIIRTWQFIAGNQLKTDS
ncbi:energy transducer TonB [Porticoccus sp. W117]|uniref:energy transducer TonB n=1 Tax=Porticoccus sp. W117 TaxID=3054777 RepID=UPI0025967D06|nr:energy transducer TonB [Porticoccus sp. W117]MDM3872050.1 energy transducer TonB [Porticoccus sp. W117]